MTCSVKHCTKYPLIAVLLSLSPLAIIASEFKIYRSRYQGDDDLFVTSESVCKTSNLSCHDYYAEKITCNKCSCSHDNDTFGYLKGMWRCFGARELRQDTGCFVRGDASDPLPVVSTNDHLRLNLSLHAECRYIYKQNTYYRTCDGKWSAAGGIGTSRYGLFGNKETDPVKPDKYQYWITVKTDADASRAFAGRIMKVNFECKQPNVKPWYECFVFKEEYVSQPVVCPKSMATVIPSVKSEISTRQNSTIPPLPDTTTPTRSTKENVTGPTTSFVETSMTSNITYYGNQDNEGTRINKHMIIGVSAAGAALLVALVITICIICCRKRQRRDISKYTAALYDSTQGSAGIYAETSIRLPSSSKSFTLTSHSNPSYERGRDFSIKIADSQKQKPKAPSSPPRLALTNESFEDDTTAVTSKIQEIPRCPVKQRGNMLVKYENVTILSDVRPESVPDAEMFYDNPGANAPQYQVLENPAEDAPSYGEYPLRLNTNNSVNQSTDKSSEDFNDVNDCIADDVADDGTVEPIYANTPAIVSNNSQENSFSFEVPEQDDNIVVQESINRDDDVYTNSEAMKSSYSDVQSAHNHAYVDDEDDEASHSNEPIYDNHSIMNNTSSSGGSPLLTNQSHQAIYQDLKSEQAQESDYQPLTPVIDRKPKPKPRPRVKRQ